MNITPRIHLFLFCFLLGCASWGGGRDSRPPWLVHPQQVYPPDRYWVAVGSGEDRRTAETEAYAALARAIRVTITERVSTREEYRREEGENLRESQRLQAVQQMETLTREDLEGVRIREVWEDPETHRIWALAVLDRIQATARLLDRIESLDRGIQQALARARSPGNPLDRLRAWRQVLQDLQRREPLHLQLQILRPTGRGVPPPVERARALWERETFLREHFILGLECDGPEADLLRGAMVSGLGRAGFRVDTTGRGDLLIQARLTLRPDPQAPPPWHYLRWHLVLRVKDPSTGQWVGAVDLEGREGGLSRDQARERIRKVLGEKGVQALLEMLEGSSQAPP